MSLSGEENRESSVLDSVGQNISRLRIQVTAKVNEIQATFGSHLERALSNWRRNILETRGNGLSSKFASIRLRSPVGVRNPIGDLGFLGFGKNESEDIEEVSDVSQMLPLDDVKRRLSTVPIYIVANDKSELVMVTQEVKEQQKQLGLFFFSKKDADDLLVKMKSQAPELAKSSKVVALGMDSIYEAFSKHNNPAQQYSNVIFRFIPETTQVSHAIDLFRTNGIQESKFVGVPVFQAEGLTINGETGPFVPLFFSKDDLDVAVRRAYDARNRQQMAEYEGRVQKYEKQIHEIQKKMEGKEASEVRKLHANLIKTQAKAERARNKAKKVYESLRPSIEVGAFEEVLTRMEEDRTGEWGNVMFIQSGALVSESDSNNSQMQ
eukprot:TRINITY_DN3328_c0_g1_i2.p2 TRINITY_DN3328_c0_g1~~TRINITY_DN3328_c0_g1_i2.p2  ORF type:complete len:379 (-),score=56.46 TRINITY_DN3328_c0_g1_i2:1797-2933(-)